LTRNAVANVIQMLAGALLLFLLYRFIIGTVGVGQLGVWSVVLATVSASRLADLGLSAGVTRFVARDLARGETVRAAEVIDSVALTLMVTISVILMALYPFIQRVIPHLFDATFLPLALDILPYAFVSLWLTILASVFLGGLDGCQRMDQRAALTVVGQAILLGLAVWLVPRYGLVGLAWSQLGQGVFLAIAGRILLRVTLQDLPQFPLRWRRSVVREMLGYGLNLQAATLFMLLMDPISKVLMARFGGPEPAGYFDVANQTVLKARAVIVAANSAIVPRVAELTESAPARLLPLYRQSVGLLIFLVLPLFVLLFAWAGLVSWVLVGTFEPQLVFMLHLLTTAWAINTVSCAAFFLNVGTGLVGWNTLIFAFMGLTNVSLGWLLGSWIGAEGVVWAYAIAIVTGAVILIGMFHGQNRGFSRFWLPREHLGLALLCVSIVVVSWIFPVALSPLDPTNVTLWLCLPPLALGAVIWNHPLRKVLWLRLASRGVAT
jgi:O-antigen/teichoic acid export membrane protein